MTDYSKKLDSSLDRQKAEELMKNRKLETNKILSEADMLKLIHELQVHQIELEMQNAELLMAKEKEKLAKEKYAELYDFAASGYLSLSKEGNIIELNISAAKILNKERLGLINNRFTLFVSEDTRSIFNLFFQKVFTSKVKETCELTLMIQNKLPINIFVTGIISENEEQCLVNLVDITERKKDEELIKQQNIELQNALEKAVKSEKLEQALIQSTRFNDILDNLPSCIYIKNNQHQYSFANKMFLDLFHKTKETVIGCMDSDFFSSDVVSKLYEIDKEILENGKTTKEEIIVELDNQEAATYLEMKFPLYDKKGNIDGLCGISTNISDIKQEHKQLLLAKEKVEESEEKYRISEMELKAAQSVAHLGNWKWDLRTSEVTWSDEMFHVFGIDKNSFTGKLGDVIANVIHPDDLHLVLPSNASEFAKKKPIGYRIIMPDKTIRYILAEAGETIVDNNGNPLFLTGIAQDITEHKKAELIIQQQNDQLIELNATKDKFFRIIAHDLKSPFISILGFSDLLAKNIAKYDLEKTTNFVKTIQSASQNAYSLLENLLEWARAQTGKIDFKPENLIIENLIIDVISLSENLAKAKNISISYKISDSLIVFADGNMLKTILRNLITNAIKFTTKNGNVTITAVQINKEIEVSINDTGVGMNEKTLSKLFKISEKSTTLGTEAEKGTGLGLLLCKEFVEKHQGKIWVESEVGIGSNFKFSIPLKDETNSFEF